MVNLIPPAAKKSVILEYWARVLTVWSLILTVVAVFFAVTLLPVYVLVDDRIEVYEESANEANQKIASYESVSQDLTRASQQAQLIRTSMNEKSLYEHIELFNQLEKDGIVYSQVSVSQVSSGVMAPVILNGNARDRQALADFRDRLLAEAVVESVDFPISNLAKDRDINFSITVTINNEIDL